MEMARDGSPDDCDTSSWKGADTVLVALERLSVDDSELLLRWRRDPEVERWMYTAHAIAAEEHRSWMARVVVNDAVDYWVINGDDGAVGTVILSPGPHHTACRDWGIHWRVERGGTGIAECAMALSLDSAFVNRASHKVLVKQCHTTSGRSRCTKGCV
jgi:RimJ/RimL family protein N-acetyltransferase